MGPNPGQGGGDGRTKARSLLRAANGHRQPGKQDTTAPLRQREAGAPGTKLTTGITLQRQFLQNTARNSTFPGCAETGADNQHRETGTADGVTTSNFQHGTTHPHFRAHLPTLANLAGVANLPASPGAEDSNSPIGARIFEGRRSTQRG